MKKTSFYLLLILFLHSDNLFSQLEKTNQLILVISKNWSSTICDLYIFEKENNKWNLIFDPYKVKIGSKGFAWGIGLHEKQNGIQKIEGDKKSPAGIFEFGTAFGYDSIPPIGTKIPYSFSDKFMRCVDDTSSLFYNQLVSEREVEKDWNSAEKMKFQDSDYKYGITVKHNKENVAGKGSCIFLHCFGKDESTTVGCTAMTEEKLKFIITWLNPEKNPRIIQLPIAEYDRLKIEWNLPTIN